MDPSGIESDCHVLSKGFYTTPQCKHPTHVGLGFVPRRLFVAQRYERHYTWQRFHFHTHQCDSRASPRWIIVSQVGSSLLITDSWWTEWTALECIKICLKGHFCRLKSQLAKWRAFVTGSSHLPASSAFKALAERTQSIFKGPDRSDSNAVVWAFISYPEICFAKSWRIRMKIAWHGGVRAKDFRL